MGHHYTPESIEEDAKRCIESFKKYVPNYKYWCPVVGGLWDASEGVISETGQFTSFKGIEWHENWKKEAAKD
jgi:hypothetical protein